MGRKVPRAWACHPVHPRRRVGGFGTNSSEGSEASPSRLVLAERCARIVRRLPPDGYAGGKIQLVHYSAAREYGLKPGHAQLTRFFRDQIDSALFVGRDALPTLCNGFQRLCLATDVEGKVTPP